MALLQDGDNISVGGYIVPVLIHSPILNFSFTSADVDNSLSDLFKKVIIVLIFQKETKADSIFPCIVVYGSNLQSTIWFNLIWNHLYAHIIFGCAIPQPSYYETLRLPVCVIFSLDYCGFCLCIE